MKVEALYIIKNNGFGEAISEWAEGKQIDVIPTKQKNNDLSVLVDAVVIFHENHNFSKEDGLTHNSLLNKNIAIHKVDINGTLAATNSNFNLWLERNQPKKLLIIGEKGIAQNMNLSKFLAGIEG
jgi:hypothetical protein